MDTFGALLSSNDRQIYLERSGMVTRCRLACEALDKGRSVALVARTREEFHAARSLAALFLPKFLWRIRQLCALRGSGPAWGCLP
jgi:hypothetical protein